MSITNSTGRSMWGHARRRPEVLISLVAAAVALAFFVPTWHGGNNIDDTPLPADLNMPLVADQSNAPESTRTPPPSLPQIEEFDLALEFDSQPTSDPIAPDLPPVVRHSVTVRAGESLLGILRGHEVAMAEALAAVEKLTPAFDPSKLNVGDTLIFVLDTPSNTDNEEGAPAMLHLVVAPKRRGGPRTYEWLGTDYSDRRVVGVVEGIAELAMPPNPADDELVLLEGTIESTFYGTALAAGATANEIDRFLRTLRGSIDFSRQIRKGDIFEALVQRRGDGESIVRYVALEGRHQKLAFYRAEFADGRVGYYDREGRSYLDMLDTRPLGNSPVTSGFGMRVHPVTKVKGLHRGTDFRARHGTPIPAAGDGVVVIRGKRGSYGHYVRIRHASGFMTAYAHLHRYAQGLTVGNRVKRGEIIGYAGSSGTVTGPHLHFEILQNGKHVDPLKVGAIPTPSLTGERLEGFRQLVAQADTETAHRRTRDVASLQSE